LLAFANYPAIDYLGELVGVARLDAVGAQTRIQFALAEILATDYVIPAGTLVGTQDGKFQFATVEDLIIQSGGDPGPLPRARSVDAVCTTKGPDGNGYAVGQVSVFLPAHPSIALISNITRTAGGAAIESTDALRARIQLAPNRFTSAGPSGAYKFFALSADPSIADVQVIGHWLDGVVINTVPPGTVKVFVLPGPIIQPAAAGTQGIASGALITEIQTALSADTIRPLTDTVVVSAVTDRNYQVKGLSPNGVTLERNVDPTSAMAALREAARNLALRIGSRIGADIVPEEWIAALGSIGSVHRVVLSEPAYSKLGPGEWANCTAITLDVTDAAGVPRGTISL
jgi:phage-related baseplate assembly protein